MKMLELIERIEALEGPDREVDAEIAALNGYRIVDEGSPIGRVCYDENSHGVPLPSYTRSLDAAMTLVPEIDCVAWDERRVIASVDCGNIINFDPTTRGPIVTGYATLKHPITMDGLGCSRAATPALALCAAALRARLQEDKA